jgi:cystathionine beta-synthase
VRDFNIGDVKETALPMVEMDMPLERLKHYISKENGAVLTKDDSGQYHILTKYDVLNAFSKG